MTLSTQHPACEARQGSDAFQLVEDGFAAVPGVPVEVRLADTAGVTVWDLECVSTDETSEPLEIVRSDPPAMLATITIPAGLGRAWILRSRVNGGLRNGTPDAALTTTLKIHVPMENGRAVAALNETFEGSRQFGWLPLLNGLARFSSYANLSSANPLDVANTSPSAGVSTLAARADHVHRIQVDGTRGLGGDASGLFLRLLENGALEFSEDGQLTLRPAMGGGLRVDDAGVHVVDDAGTLPGALLADTGDPGVGGAFAFASHRHPHGALPGGNRHAVASASQNGFMSIADKAKLDAVPLPEFIATLDGGKLAPAQRSGWVPFAGVVSGAPTSITSTSFVSQGSVSAITPPPSPAVFSVVEGDVVDGEFLVDMDSALTGNYNTEFSLRTAGTARVLETVYVGARTTLYRQRFIVGAGQAGSLSAQVRMAKVGSAATTTPNVVRFFLTVTRPG